MIWVTPAVFSAFFDAIHNVLVKKFLRDIDQYTLGAGSFLIASLILFLISAVRGIPEIGPAFYSSLLVTAAILFVAQVLYFKALKIADLSLSVPILSLSPLFLIVTSFIFLKEIPTILGNIGIFLIVVGSYVLNFNKKRADFSGPFKEIFRNKGSFYMLLVAFLFSFAPNFSKLLVLNSDTTFGSSMILFLVGLLFLITSFLKNHDFKTIHLKNLKIFFLVGIIAAFTEIALNTAYTMQIVPYVISVKRLSVLFSVFFGFLIFKEKHILQRSLAALIMLAGIILIVFS